MTRLPPPIRSLLLTLCSIVFALTWAPCAGAQTPIALYESFAGDLDYVVTGGSLRTSPNSGAGANACAVGASSSNPLAGIPPGSNIVAAYLYWSGSGSTVDSTVSLNGTIINADRTFTAPFVLGTTYDFFSGFADVTAQVSATGNANYTFSGLSVNTGAPHCAVQAVIAGWSIIAIYENSTTERLRVINVFDGFQIFRGSSITLTPNNFVIPNSPDGSHTIVTWDGDTENSAPLGGFTEQLSFNGAALTDGLSPLSNQFNSTINVLPSTTDYGVDIDRYDISSLLTPGDTSASTVYSSGGDLVILQMEVLAVANAETADLQIEKTHNDDFIARQNNDFEIIVSNNGPSPDPGPISVSDNLPSGLSFTSATGSGWSCALVGTTVSCSHPGPLAVGNSLPPITLTTLVDDTLVPSVTNIASVSSPRFDNVMNNDQSTDIVLVSIESPNLLVEKSVLIVDDPYNDMVNPKNIPGAVVEYTIAVSNQGLGPVDGSSLVLNDALPDNLSLLIQPGSGDPIVFTDGSTTSDLTVDAAANISYSNQPGGGPPFDYDPVADPTGFDPDVTGIQVRPQGIFPGSRNGNDPTFAITFQAQLE